MEQKKLSDYVSKKYHKMLVDMLWDLSEQFPEKDAISVDSAKGSVIIYLNNKKRKHHEKGTSL